MKKVLFVIDSLKIGGAEKSMVQIFSRFSRITPLVCTIYEGEELKSVYEESGIKVISIRSVAKYDFFSNAKKLRKVIISVDPDIVVCSLFRASIITRLALLGIKKPLLGTFVNEEYPAHKFASSKFKGKIAFILSYIIDLATISMNDHIVANSKAIKHINSRRLLYPIDKISVIPRGREIDEFSVSVNSPIVNGEIIISNVGRLIERKGQYELIEAFAIVNNMLPQTRLVIAGEGPFRCELEKLVKIRGLQNVVEFYGQISDVNSFLSSSHIFVFPSHYEGFSGALIEAMLSGLLIVCSDIEMNTEAIQDNFSGITFSTSDVGDLSEKLKYAIINFNELNYYGLNARKIAKEKYDIDKISELQENLYLSLC